MKTMLSFVLALGVFISLYSVELFAQNDGRITQETVVEDFSAIRLDGIFEVVLKSGDKTSIAYETSASEPDLIVPMVKNGELSLKLEELKSSEVPKITITYRKIESITTEGAVNIRSDGSITSDKLTLKHSGASDAAFDINVNELKTNLSGAASLALSGNAPSHEIQLSGASTLNARKLVSRKADVKASGASTAWVNVSDEIGGEISGASNLYMESKPPVYNVKEMGVSSSGITDTTKIKFGNKNIMIMDDKDKTGWGDPEKKPKKSDKTQMHWAGVHIGINGLLNNKKEFKPPVGFDFLEPDYAKSWFVDVNVTEHGIRIIKKHMAILTGLGISVNNYRFDNNFVLQPNVDYAKGIEDTVVAFSKNKLTTVYLQAPLLLQFDTKKLYKKNTLHLSFGLVGGIRIGSHTKQVYEIDGVKFKPKTRDDFSLSPFRYSALVKIGFGNFNLFASYQLNGLFRDKKGPQMYPFNVGITLAGW